MAGPAVRRPPMRLGSLKQRPQARRPRPQPQADQQASTEKRCTNPTCGGTNIAEEDGYIVCKDCFTQIAEANIVADVQFNEDSGGRATVQGASVAENSRHAKTLGAETFKRLGGGGRNSLAEAERTGKRALASMCPRLGISEDISLQAESLWTLASNINFCAGRKTDEVIAACLYAACRRRKDNAVLLMDLAELIKVGVFRLGEVYRKLCKELFLNEESVGHQHLVELEPLIHKYCSKLQFAEKTNIVAEDALKIIRRMNKDWMVSGRHPAGLCGACIILAARMNNFHRSVREVVYVSKVADVTIAKRVEEFRKTKSAGLTVQEFREFGNRIKYQHDPPSMSAAQDRMERIEKQKRKREDYRQSMARDSQDRGSVVEIPDDATDASSRLSSLAPGTPAAEDDEQTRPQKRQRTQGPDVQLTPPATQQQATSQQQAQPGAPSTGAAPQFVPVNTPPQTQGSAKRKRDDGDDQESDEDPSSKRPRTAEPDDGAARVPPLQQVRRDADGFVIPALPKPRIDPGTSVQDEKPAKRGRKRKEEEAPKIDLSQEELDVENDLEQQIQDALENDEVHESQSEVEKAKEEEKIAEELKRAQALSEVQQKVDAEKTRARRDAGPDGNWFGPAPTGEIVTAEELEKEFENDPEVAICLLSPEDVKSKERIWLSLNEDWMRKQAEKELMAKVAKPSSRRKGKKGEGKRGRKKGKIGDGSVLTESSTPIETPADAARAMLEKRAKTKSKFVDYTALERMYGRETPSRASSSAPGGSGSGSGSQSGEQTPAAGRQQSATPAPTEPESQVDEGAAASTAAASPAAASPDAGDEEEEEEQLEEDEQEPMTSPRQQIQAPTWDNMDDDAEDDDMYNEGETDFRSTIHLAEEVDEFGIVGGENFYGDDYGDSGDEYE